MKTNPPNVFAYLLETLLLIMLGIGITYAGIYVAGQFNRPVSKNLIEDGRWLFYSWRDFPALDCTGMFLGMAILPIVWERYRKTKSREIGFSLPAHWPAYFVLALVIAIVFTQITRGITFLQDSKLSPSQISFFAAYFCCVSATEETMFRGILQRRIKNISSPSVAVFVSVVLFVLWHNVPDTPQAFLLRILGALLIAILYELSHSLYIPILLHWLINMGQI